MNEYDDGWLGGWVNTQFCHWETGDLRSPNISFGEAASHKLRICEVEKQIFKHLTFNLPISEAFLQIRGLGFDNIPTDWDSLKVTQKMLDDFDT